MSNHCSHSVSSGRLAGAPTVPVNGVGAGEEAGSGWDWAEGGQDQVCEGDRHASCHRILNRSGWPKMSLSAQTQVQRRGNALRLAVVSLGEESKYRDVQHYRSARIQWSPFGLSLVGRADSKVVS